MNTTVQTIFGLAGGLAMFLFGMNMMSEGLQKAAGDKMKKILAMLTKNPILGVLAGTVVTAVLQSSSATTVMVIGFVSAGLMTLPQAISVILGANIGTTMTAQLMAFKISDYIWLIVFVVASIYSAAFPAMMLSRNGGSEITLGLVNAVIGVTMLVGSILASFMKTPKSRIRVICNCLLFSMATENILLALGRTPLIWCIGGFLGWLAIPIMSTNMEAILRLHIPENMQGRVYSVRNSLQFFTIPVGYLLGGILVDQVFEPIMANQGLDSLLVRVFGCGKGSGAAFLFFVIAFAGVAVCLFFRRDKHLWELDHLK